MPLVIVEDEEGYKGYRNSMQAGRKELTHIFDYIRVQCCPDQWELSQSAIKELKLDFILHSASHPLKAGYGKEDLPFCNVQKDDKSED